jgi:hypothetical protein
MVCLPVAANVTLVACANHQAVFCHPQPETPHPEQRSRLTINPLVLPIRYAALPLANASENCTHTASFPLEFAAARSRSQTRYEVFAGASNVISK